MQSFLDYLLNADFRYYQERDLGLDLYHSGLWGLALASLAVASATVFLLAIFHVIPRRRHVLGLLLGLGGAALGLGLAATGYHYSRLAEVASRIIRDTAGSPPANARQEAALVALPLITGGAVLLLDLLGCLYMALFWGGSWLAPEAGEGTGTKRRSGR